MPTSPETIDLLLRRRSFSAKAMVPPGPDDAQLDLVLRAGHRVPDHGKLGPWRFIVIRGDARERLGAVAAGLVRADDPAADPVRLEVERTRFLRAPVVVCVTSRTVPAKVPEWEQVLSAGAACQNILLAAHALGFGANWLTEWPAYDARFRGALGLAEGERVAGFIYIGSAVSSPEERVRPALADVVSEWREISAG